MWLWECRLIHRRVRMVKKKNRHQFAFTQTYIGLNSVQGFLSVFSQTDLKWGGYSRSRSQEITDGWGRYTKTNLLFSPRVRGHVYITSLKDLVKGFAISLWHEISVRTVKTVDLWWGKEAEEDVWTLEVFTSWPQMNSVKHFQAADDSYTH